MHVDKLLLAIIVVVLISACKDKNPSPGDSGHEHEHVSGISDGVWPPQPTNASNMKILPPKASTRAAGGARESVLDAARQAVMTNPNTRALLGENFRLFNASLADPKASDTASFVFYNYSTNQTIIASLQPDGAIDNQVMAAEQFQPAEHPEEAAQAIQMADEALTAAGFNTDELIGTALLAFPPVAQISNQQQHFYPQRILYVTFGPGDGELPVYSALINIGSATVIESGLLK